MGADVTAPLAFTAEQAAEALDVVLAALQHGDLPLAVKPEVAAKMLGISVKMLAQLPIRSVKLGHRTRRYPLKQLLAFLEERAA